jgi:choline dehydrogenase-like flavoprotein
LSAVYLVKRFFTHQISPEYSKELAASEYRNIGKHFRNVLLDAPNFARFSIHWLFYRILAARKFPSVAMPSASNTYTIHFDAEQSPNRESRVTLSDECDALGMPKLHVSWRHTAQDIESVARCYAVVKSELEAAGLAALEFDANDVDDLLADRVGVGSHHIGTTRMSEHPRLGVVDKNCRLHSVDNLFVASPSVFPTTSFANPVLTTAALAIRLADHLKHRF